MKGQLNVTWNEPGDWAYDTKNQLNYSILPMVADDDGPAMQVVIIKYDAGARIPTHYHATDYCSVVVEGSIEITRRLHEVGCVRLVRAGTAYGPLEAGPEGCTVVDIFATGTLDPEKSPKPVYVRDTGQWTR